MNKTDAFTHGQIRSKLWLCRELEKLNWSSQQQLETYKLQKKLAVVSDIEKKSRS